MRLLSFFSSSGMDEQPMRYLFTRIHLIYVLACAFIFIVLMRVMLRQKRSVRMAFVNVCLILILLLKYAGEALFISEWYTHDVPVSTYSHPFWDYRTFFSFQMCGVDNILLPLVIWFKLKPLKDYVFTASILGGLSVMLYPLGVLSGDPFVFTFPMLRSMFIHLMLVFLPCFLIASGETKVEARHWKRTLVGLFAMAGWAMFGNLFVDWNANNMYLVINPFYGGPVPIISAIPNGWHVLLLAAMVFIGFFLVYQFIRIFDHIARRRILLQPV